ncbi:MAG: GNVR domain-containing protein [Hyphomicrobiales bacterium]
MLQKPIQPQDLAPSLQPEALDFSIEDIVDIDRLVAAARRQARVIVTSVVLGLLLGVFYLLTAVPQYTASTLILIDNRKLNAVADVSGTSDFGFDSSAVDSQVELIKSEKIALAVIAKLDLVNDAGFMSAQRSIIGRVIGGIRAVLDVRNWFADAELVDAEAAFAAQRAAVKILRDNIEVSRVGRTYVLNILYTAPDARKAADITNAFGDAYLTDQLDSKYEATRRATDWLQGRIDELKRKSLESDLAVQKFRSENNLIAANGRLVSDQQLSELNSELIVARSDTARAEAKYERIKSIIDTGKTDAVVTEALDNSVINDLRAKYLEASKRNTEISDQLGVNHVQAVRLRNEMDEYRRLIFDELRRIAESYQSDFQVARTREKSLEDSLNSMLGVTATANETLVALRELERESETYKNLYQTFLQRFQEATQQESFPITEARIITAATRPLDPSKPRKALVLVLSLMLGGLIGVGVGAAFEYYDRVFRTGDQVRDELDREFIGMLARVPAVVVGPETAAAEEGKAEAGEGRALDIRSQIMRYVLDAPMSGFAETLRSAKVALDLTHGEKKPKIIGIVSALPGEGKSTVSKNFATLLAAQGARTLLIDGDMRNPGLTRSIARHAEAGLVEALLDEHPLRDLYLMERDSMLVFLPTVLRRRLSHTSDLVSSPAMRRVLAEAGATFDYVVVDLPPLGPVVDARAAAPVLDAFLFVVEWGRTHRKMVRAILRNNAEVREKCIGVVLNKVNSDKLKMYEDYGSKDYYYGHYKNYYHEAG